MLLLPRKGSPKKKHKIGIWKIFVDKVKVKLLLHYTYLAYLKPKNGATEVAPP